MITPQEIESAIKQLSIGAKWDLFHSLQNHLWTEWDRQIEADEKADRRDARKLRLSAGEIKPLNEVLGQKARRA